MKNPAVPDIPDDDVRRSVGYISLIIGNDALTTYGESMRTSSDSTYESICLRRYY